jgi:hypothetical protein
MGRLYFFGVVLALAGAIPLQAGETPGAYNPKLDLWEMSDNIPSAPDPTCSGARVSPWTSVQWVFTDIAIVNDDTTGDMYLWPDCAVSGLDTVHAIWFDNRLGDYHIFYSQSADGGRTWSENEQVDDMPPGGMCRFPSVCVDHQGSVYACWEDSRLGTFDCYFSKRVSIDREWVWIPSIKVNEEGGSPGGGDYVRASITTGRPGNIYVAWTDWREGDFHQVYFSRSTDYGETWSENVRISDKEGYKPVAGSPCLLVDQYGDEEIPTLYCVWNDWREDSPGGRYPNVYFSMSTDAGETWSANIQVNDIIPYYQQVAHRVLGVDGDNTIYVAWFNWDFVGTPDMRVSVSTDGGTSFMPSVQVNDPEGDVGTYPCLVVDEWGNAYAAWQDGRSTGRWDLTFAESSDLGQTWTSPNLSVVHEPEWKYHYNPIVDTDEHGNVYFVWQNSLQAYRWDVFATKGNPAVDIQLVPDTIPVVIPPEGGTFGFTATVINRSDGPITFWTYTTVTLPNGKETDPIRGPIKLTLDPGESVSKHLRERVPGGAPDGTYRYNGYVALPDQSQMDRDRFTFMKVSSSSF